MDFWSSHTYWTENAACTNIGGTVAWWHGFAPKADGIMLGFQEGSKKYYAYLRNTNCISLCLHHKLLLGEVDLKPLPCWQLHESRPFLDKDGLLDLELHAARWSLNDNRPWIPENTASRPNLRGTVARSTRHRKAGPPFKKSDLFLARCTGHGSLRLQDIRNMAEESSTRCLPWPA